MKLHNIVAWEAPPEAPHGTADPTQSVDVRCVQLDSTGTLAVYCHGFGMNNQTVCRALAKWLKHSSKHSNKTVDRNGWVGKRFAIVYNTALRDVQSIKQCLS